MYQARLYTLLLILSHSCLGKTLAKLAIAELEGIGSMESRNLLMV